MIRKLTLGAVVAVVSGFGAQATAGEPLRRPVGPSGYGGGFVPGGHQRHDHDYVVFVRHGWHWDRVGRFETRYEAERVADRLERRGERMRVEVVEGGRRW